MLKTVGTEIAKVFITAFIGGTLALWWAGATLEYKIAYRNNYFNVPSALKNNISIKYKQTTITNISVVDVLVFNRTFSDQSNVELYFKFKPKDNKKTPKLVSVKMSPPSSLTNVGLSEIKNVSTEGGFKIDLFKQTQRGEYYLINFIFEGDETPDIQVSTNTKNVNIKKYSDMRDSVLGGIIALFFYALIIAPVLLWTRSKEKKNKVRFLEKFKSALREQPEIVNYVDNVVTVYETVTKPKPSFIKRLLGKE